MFFVVVANCAESTRMKDNSFTSVLVGVICKTASVVAVVDGNDAVRTACASPTVHPIVVERAGALVQQPRLSASC